MADRFFITELEIPKGVPGISDLFKNVRLCNNGSIVVCYREPVALVGVNRGDVTLTDVQIVTRYQGYNIPTGAMLALDVQRLT